MAIIYDLNEFLTLVEENHCPAGLKIFLADNELTDIRVQHLADVLESGKCPPGLEINLGDNQLTDASTQYLARALESGKCPAGLTIYLGNNQLTDASVKCLANTLKSGNCPSGLTIGLGYNQLTDASVKYLARALESGKCPPGLTIILGIMQQPTNAIAQYLAEAFKSGMYPQALTIKFLSESFTEEGTQFIINALKQKTPRLGLNVTVDDDKQDEITTLCREPFTKIPGLYSFWRGRYQPSSSVYSLPEKVFTRINGFVMKFQSGKQARELVGMFSRMNNRIATHPSEQSTNRIRFS